MLTHWGLDKMDAISQTTFSSIFYWMKMYELRFKNSLKFVPKGPINNIPALVQIMAWRRPGDKPLSEPMLVILPTPVAQSEGCLNILHGSGRTFNITTTKPTTTKCYGSYGVCSISAYIYLTSYLPLPVSFVWRHVLTSIRKGEI